MDERIVNHLVSFVKEIDKCTLIGSRGLLNTPDPKADYDVCVSVSNLVSTFYVDNFVYKDATPLHIRKYFRSFMPLGNAYLYRISDMFPNIDLIIFEDEKEIGNLDIIINSMKKMYPQYVLEDRELRIRLFELELQHLLGWQRVS